ncbi:mannosyl-oligosaccharide glucosidase [Malassezia vespertilionis]|uniref:mannosyl-oligosaccharide glucosidase n=1 Tax=Malassezia vespertilionis TaxID=2020962 RepID=UPI0024B157FB|nr:mannosyl-oligosaccharide glucosidase [Malassezia vespertilionis]WFD07739.1 mannosyl-oligosaccharide glucosidase [Malassezia vespertilionis]
MRNPPFLAGLQLLQLILAFAACISASSDVVGDPGTVWGTYRPQVLFGMRPRLPDSLVTGLAYFATRDYHDVNNMRHSSAENQGIDGYGWTYHDGRTFGVQEIMDRANNYKIETSFVKTGHESSPGNWAVRIKGTVIDRDDPAELAVVYYIGSESPDTTLSIHGTSDGPSFSGTSPVFGNFTLKAVQPTINRYAHNVSPSYTGIQAPYDEVWRGKEYVLSELATNFEQIYKHGETDINDLPPAATVLQLHNNTMSQATFYALQHTFTGDFTLDWFFESADTPRAAHMDSAAFSGALAQHKHAYEDRFETQFQLAKQGFSPEEIAQARQITAQVLGGIGFYHGDSLVDSRELDNEELNLHEPESAQPQIVPSRALLTATPSRSFFPRGFYWDEGFHLLHIGAWDMNLSMQLFESWTSLIDDKGWVAREQILGKEAHSWVPDAFKVQFPNYANPPALIMGLNAYLDKLAAVQDMTGVAEAAQQPFALGAARQGGKPRDPSLLARLYEPWRRHYLWYRDTQRGQVRQWDRDATAKGEAFRWRGRSQTHVLTSGLDDYPRATEPHIGELHVDLHAWMGWFARAMHRFAKTLGMDDDAVEYEHHAAGIQNNLKDLHWDAQSKLFCDASVDEFEESYLECHPGYVSLFPLLMELLPADSDELGATLAMMHDPAQLWSHHGLRSLSKQHPLYRTGEDYWRSAVWVPVNYLALRALHNHYAVVNGPYRALAQAMYTALRKNIIDTVLNAH